MLRNSLMRSAYPALLAIALGLAPGALAQAPAAVQAPVQLRFDIERFAVQGNTLLPQDEVERIVARFSGRQRDFGDVQRALEALEAAYRARGYSAVQVLLPEQDLEKGVVTLRVIEARIKTLAVRGNRFFSEANVRASLPSLAEGRSPNAGEVARNLRIVNESPAKQTTVALRAGREQGEVDALVEVEDESPRKWFVTLDNSGTGATGYYRAGIGYQHSNLFDRDHAVTLQLVTSDAPSRVGIYSVGYHFPLYARGASMDLVAGYSDVDAGTTSTPTGPLTFSGRGGILGARYNQHFERIVGYDHKLVLGLDHRMYRNSCALGAFGAAGCGTAGATFSLTPVSLTYAGSWTLTRGQAGFHASAIANLAGGSRGDTDALGRARFGAKGGYRLYRAGANFARATEGDWQLRARIELQHSDEVLVPPEQFGIGGATSVRGFLERERADDRGRAGQIELYTPELAQRLAWKDWNLRLLAFYDFGRTSRVNPLAGEQVRNDIASAGLGLRLSKQKAFALRLDLAQIVEEGGTRQRNHQRVVFSSVWSF
jgi:hemolysin activation/secretion protein